jgi:hypothetical protein
MWILESNGDFLQGKRMWLKPGQRYLFGRVRKEAVLFAIDHKTVSRKHFIIEVDNVKEGDAGQIHTRTKIRIIDQNSKSGTTVNAETIKNGSKELKDAENSVRPGTFPSEIIIKWHPCVLTFSFLKKEIKSGVLKTKQARVESLDIKAVGDFSSDNTTHVVVNKRNTAKGLQGLVAGKYLVAESFIDALEYGATPQNLSQDENLSLLETDFDSAWPNPEDHLPPPGKEPTIRPAESYQPDPARATIFEGYTFVFVDQTQYDNLLPVITSGHGKAMMFKMVNGETTSNDLIGFLQNAAGHKANGQPKTTAESKVVLVRWSGKDDIQEWMNQVINETALKMDQRAIDQSEFLDAILANDAGLLQQSVPFESTNDGKVAPANSLVTRQPSEVRANTISERTELKQPRRTASVSSATSEAAPDDVQEQVSTRLAKTTVPAADPSPSQISSRNVSQASSKIESAPRPFTGPRFTQKSGFKNFDDAFDPDEIIDYEGDEDDEAEVLSPQAQQQTTSIKEEPQSVKKKRPRSPSPDAENAFAEEMDDLLPAAAAFKRQRTAQARANGQAGSKQTETSRAAAKKVKKEREIDVRKVVKAKREEEEEAARRAREQFEAMGDVEDKTPANLVTVVNMELPLRERSKNINKVNGARGDTWDPKWNGRTNFKGFRRKGEAAQRRGHATKVIVPLVAIEQPTQGLGDQYWPKTNGEKEREHQQKRKDEARSRKSQSQTQRSSGTLSGRSRGRVISEDEDENSDEGEPRNDDAAASTSPTTTRLQREAAEIVDHEIDPDTPRRTRAADKSQAASRHEDTTQATTTQSSTARGKRPATSTLATDKIKRQKTLPVTVVRGSDDEDDDSDDMKFRFGSRARKGRAAAKGK